MSVEAAHLPEGTVTVLSTDLVGSTLTVFGQMILNRGRYGDARILSPAAVAAMTRDQIPGIKARFFDKLIAHGS